MEVWRQSTTGEGWLNPAGPATREDEQNIDDGETQEAIKNELIGQPFGQECPIVIILWVSTSIFQFKC
jgi:hypothetical protein